MVAPSLPPAEDLQLILKLILTPSLRYLSTTTSRLWLYCLLYGGEREGSWTFSIQAQSDSLSTCIWLQGGVTMVFMWNNFNRLSFYCIKSFLSTLRKFDWLIKWEYHQPCSRQISPSEILSCDQWTNPDAEMTKNTLWFISHMCTVWRLPGFLVLVWGFHHVLLCGLDISLIIQSIKCFHKRKSFK